MTVVRRPRPLRALLLAHALGVTEPLRRGRGRIAFAAFITFYALLFALPLMVGMGALGTQVLTRDGPRQEGMNAALALCTTLYVLTLGFSGGLDGTSRRLSWEALRMFPVTTRTLFAAELCASVIGVVSLPALLGLVSFCVAACVVNPRGTALYLVLLGSHALVLLALPLLVASLLQRASRNLRLTLIVVPIAGIMTMGGAASLLESLSKTSLGRLSALLREGMRFLPSQRLFAAASALHHGSASAVAVLLGSLVPLATAGCWLLLTHWVVAREKPLPAHAQARAGRLWTFTHPVWGVARLQLQTVLGSIAGRFALVLPVVALSFVRMPVVRDLGSHWATASAFLYATLVSSGLLANQFGLDRHGVKVLLLLPIDERTLLRGKLLGYGMWSALSALILATLLALLQMATAESIVVGVAVHGCMFVLLAMIGTPLSIAHPVPMRTDRVQGRTQSVSLLRLLVFPAFLLGGALVAALLGAATYWLPGWQPLAMVAAFVALLGVQQATVPLSARYLVRHRERLVEQLGGAA